MTPILNGSPGVILLTLVVALGAYIRQVYVTASDTYDGVINGRQDDPYILWPLSADYTQARLKNLEYLLEQLRRVTGLLFLFVGLASIRLVAYALDTAWINGPLISNTIFHIWDMALIVFLAFTFVLMWWTYAKSSRKDYAYRKEMRKAVKERQDKITKGPLKLQATSGGA